MWKKCNGNVVTPVFKSYPEMKSIFFTARSSYRRHGDDLPQLRPSLLAKKRR